MKDNNVEIMVDLETMSTRPNAAIVAIGATAFRNGKIVDEFYSTVSLASSVGYGLDVSASTIIWWMKQSEAARKDIYEASEAIDKVLVDFSRWCEGFTIDAMWGNGVDFDNVILSNAYQTLGMKQPWPYYANRCFRTMRAEHPIAIKVANDDGVKHNALDDATWQTYFLLAMRRGDETI